MIGLSTKRAKRSEMEERDSTHTLEQQHPVKGVSIPYLAVDWKSGRSRESARKMLYACTCAGTSRDILGYKTEKHNIKRKPIHENLRKIDFAFLM